MRPDISRVHPRPTEAPIRRLPALILGILTLFFALGPAPVVAVRPKPVRVRLQTDLGPIIVEVDPAHAPITANNFLAYVDQKRFDGTFFYRAAHNKGSRTTGLIQAGIDHFIPKALAPIAHEPTSKTGLRHGDGTLSMARNAPGTAMGDFFITIGTASSYLDAKPGYPGYAAFGRVISGMPLVRRILLLPTYPGGYTVETKGQTIIKQPVILSARRVP